MDIFDTPAPKSGRKQMDAPLAERVRPTDLKDFVGQEHITGKGGILEKAISADRLFSMILWGPPGCGKTSLARIMATRTRSHFVQISAVLSGVKDIKAVVQNALKQKEQNRRTVLFVDEIHRFNKAQQDAFLHHVESGLIILVGATTENPSFEVISALLSRCRVLVLHPLSETGIMTVLKKALADEDRGLGRYGIQATKGALEHLAKTADGDARTALNGLELAVSLFHGEKKAGAEALLTLADVEKALLQKALRYDKSGEEHYNLISALHKSMRGSDPDAALYWLQRMLQGGEDPLYIARRMVRFAVEDVGIADPAALTLAMSAMEAFRFLGLPEGELALAQAAVYLATAPKSNRVYRAASEVKKLVKKTGSLPVPLHIRNAPTALMKELGYGKGYQYAHDFKDAYASQEYLPKGLDSGSWYEPSDRGYEKIVKDRLLKWREHKRKTTKKPPRP